MGPETTSTPFPGWGVMAVYVIVSLVYLEAGRWAIRQVTAWAAKRGWRPTWRLKLIVAVPVMVATPFVDLYRIVVFPAAAWHWSAFVGWRAVRRYHSTAPAPPSVLVPYTDVTSAAMSPDGQGAVQVIRDGVTAWEALR